MGAANQSGAGRKTKRAENSNRRTGLRVMQDHPPVILGENDNDHDAPKVETTQFPKAGLGRIYWPTALIGCKALRKEAK
jgi:hypothetical protein